MKPATQIDPGRFDNFDIGSWASRETSDGSLVGSTMYVQLENQHYELLADALKSYVTWYQDRYR